METVRIRIKAAEDEQDMLVGVLSDLPVSAFENEPECISVYLEASAWNDAVRAAMKERLRLAGRRDDFDEQRIAPQNWNAIWEASYKPILVEPFFVRASWHARSDTSEGLIEIVVDPKMSFGTGHHETTRLMLRHLADIPDGLGTVLDAGTGTGILAIAAALLDADFVVAFDLDPMCVANAKENLALNGVSDRVGLRCGSLEAVDERDFSTLLANINLGVLIRDIPGYALRLAPGGRAVFSGVLLANRPALLDAMADAFLRPVSEREEGAWWSVMAEKASA